MARLVVDRAVRETLGLGCVSNTLPERTAEGSANVAVKDEQFYGYYGLRSAS
jgi:hypothetical protein